MVLVTMQSSVNNVCLKKFFSAKIAAMVSESKIDFSLSDLRLRRYLHVVEVTHFLAKEIRPKQENASIFSLVHTCSLIL